MPRLRSGSKAAYGAACGFAIERDWPRSYPRVAVTRWRMQQRIHIGAAAKTHRANVRWHAATTRVFSAARRAWVGFAAATAALKPKATQRAVTDQRQRPESYIGTFTAVARSLHTDSNFKEQRCAFGYSSSAMC